MVSLRRHRRGALCYGLSAWARLVPRSPFVEVPNLLHQSLSSTKPKQPTDCLGGVSPVLTCHVNLDQLLRFNSIQFKRSRGASSGQFPRISGIAVNQPWQSYQWGLNNVKNTIRKTKPRGIEWRCYLYFYEVGTAEWPREFDHGNLILKEGCKRSVAIRFLLRKKKKTRFD